MLRRGRSTLDRIEEWVKDPYNDGKEPAIIRMATYAALAVTVGVLIPILIIRIIQVKMGWDE